MKYIGTIVDGKWKVVNKPDRDHYIIKNIYNNTELKFERRMLVKIAKGEASVSKYVYKKLRKRGIGYYGGW